MYRILKIMIYLLIPVDTRLPFKERHYVITLTNVVGKSEYSTRQNTEAFSSSIQDTWKKE